MRRDDLGRLIFLLTRAVVFSAVLAGLGSAAWAEHTAEEHITDESAYTLPQGEVRLGLWKVEVGAFDSLTLTTHTVPWFVLMANLGAKVRFYDKEPWALSAKLSFFNLDVNRLSKAFGGGEVASEASLNIVPFEFFVSYRLRKKPLTINTGIIFTGIDINGELDSDDVQGAAALSNVMLTTNAEYRWTERSALVFFFRAIVLQAAEASTRFTLALDEFTTVEINGGIDAEGDGGAALGNAFQLGFAYVYSSGSFNMRLGAGFGDIIVPVLNVGVPTRKRTILPELDFYWVF